MDASSEVEVSHLSLIESVRKYAERKDILGGQRRERRLNQATVSCKNLDRADKSWFDVRQSVGNETSRAGTSIALVFHGTSVP